jgi:hypothetical protein
MDSRLPIQRHLGGRDDLGQAAHGRHFGVRCHERRAVEVALRDHGVRRRGGADDLAVLRVAVAVEDRAAVARTTLLHGADAAGQHQALGGIDAGRVLHHVRVQPEDLRPKERVAQVRAGDLPQRVALADDVHPLLRGGLLLLCGDGCGGGGKAGGGKDE